MKPFQQLPLDEVPPRPRVSHRYFEIEASEVLVQTAWGPCRTHVRTCGEGPPLLLLHGLMTAGYSWRYVLDTLGAHFTLVIPDLPHAGRTERPRHGCRPVEIAQWLSGLQRALDIRGCSIIGNSMGGYLAMVWALEDPSAVGRVVNLHGPGFPEPRLHALQAVFKVPGSHRLLRALIERDPRRWVQRNVHYFDESLKSLEELDEYAAPLLGRAGAQSLAKILTETMDPRAMAAFQVRLQSEGFPVPLQLVYARQDPLVPPAYGARYLERVPTATLVMLDRGSHFAHVDAPEDFVTAVLPFLLAES